MQFFQPTLHPPAENVSFEGQTAIITGANTGIGLETARQLLQRRAAAVILAVRTVQKGEAAKATLLADPTIRALHPHPSITTMQLDMADYASVTSFAAAFQAAHPRLDLLILNAGVGPVVFARSASGHERAVQVNYLSNAALLFALLPLLHATAQTTGAASRVTWVGSRAHRSALPSLIGKAPLDDEDVFAYLDDERRYSGFARYPDSKLLGVMFLDELAQRVGVAEGRVVVNMCCPGMVFTGIADVLPWYVRVPLKAVKMVRARTAEQGAWVSVNAAAGVGAESHGVFLLDMERAE